MDLFVRESGPVGAPTIVFLHGGYTSGWSWEPVVERMQQYRCLVPDLPHLGPERPAHQVRPAGVCSGADEFCHRSGGSAHLEWPLLEALAVVGQIGD